MAEQASEEFPDTRIVISTLLPRTDTPPHVIHDINMEIRRGCAPLPNVHLASHPTVGTWDLYDGLHLHKERMGIFAKTLKDTALGHNPSTPPVTRSFRDHPRPPRTPPPPPPPPPQYEAEPEEATFPLLGPCPPTPFTISAAEIYNSTVPYPPPHPQQQRYAAAAPVPYPPHPQQRSYAAVVAQPTTTVPPPATSELGDIREMLRT
ncbi:hypothetical protein VZT92_002074 [Zoarces viviparus]